MRRQLNQERLEFPKSFDSIFNRESRRVHLVKTAQDRVFSYYEMVPNGPGVILFGRILILITFVLPEVLAYGKTHMAMT